MTAEMIYETYLQFPPSLKKLLRMLQWMQNKMGWIFAGIKYFVEKTGFSEPTIKRGMMKLIKLGWVKSFRRYRQTSSRILIGDIAGFSFQKPPKKNTVLPRQNDTLTDPTNIYSNSKAVTKRKGELTPPVVATEVADEIKKLGLGRLSIEALQEISQYSLQAVKQAGECLLKASGVRSAIGFFRSALKQKWSPTPPDHTTPPTLGRHSSFIASLNADLPKTFHAYEENGYLYYPSGNVSEKGQMVFSRILLKNMNLYGNDRDDIVEANSITRRIWECIKQLD